MLTFILRIIIILAQSRWLRLAHVLERAEEVRRTCIQILCFAELLEREAAAEELVRFAEEVHAFLQVVHQVHVAVVVGAVDERELERGARVAAVEDHE